MLFAQLEKYRPNLLQTLDRNRNHADGSRSHSNRNDEALVALAVCLEWLTNQKTWAICEMLVNHGLRAAGDNSTTYTADQIRKLVERYQERDAFGYANWCHYFDSHIHFREGVEKPLVPQSPDPDIDLMREALEMQASEPETPEF